MTKIHVGPCPLAPALIAGPTTLVLNYSIDVGINEVSPMAYAGDGATLTDGGGTVLWPGDHGTFSGRELWVRSPYPGPSVGPLISVEQTDGAVRTVTRDLIGVLQAATAAKLASAPTEDVRPAVPGGRRLPPGVWHNLTSGVVGTFGIGLLARGGDIYVGTHMVINKPGGGGQYHPKELPLIAGGCTCLPQDQWMWFPGNHVWMAYTDDADAVVEMWKLERGRSWNPPPVVP